MKGIFFYFITALFLLNLSGQQKTTLGQKLNFINQLESYYSNITIYENSKRLSNQNFLKNQFDLILEKQKQINLKPEELLKNETDWLEFTGKSSSFLFFNSFADESIKKNALEQAFEIVELDVKKLLKNKLDKKKFENSSLQGSQLEQAMNLAYYSWFSQRLGQAFVRRFDKIANQYLPYVRKELTYSSAIPKSIIQYCLQNNKYEDVKILSLKYDYLLESEHKRQLNLIKFKKKIQNNNPTNSDIISDYTAYFELYYDLMSLNLKYSDKLHDIATKLIKSYNEEPNSLNFKSLPKLEKNQARRIINYLVEATKDNQDWRIFLQFRFILFKTR